KDHRDGGGAADLYQSGGIRYHLSVHPIDERRPARALVWCRFHINVLNVDDEESGLARREYDVRRLRRSFIVEGTKFGFPVHDLTRLGWAPAGRTSSYF